MKKSKVVAAIMLPMFLFFGIQARATTESSVYFEGPSEAALDSSVTISVFLNATEPVNAIDLQIAYPKTVLKFISFDNARSIVDIWQGTPAQSEAGKVNLTGGIFKPFVGQKGLIGKITFRIMGEGSPKIYLFKDNVYIADGKGTKLPIDSLSFAFSITKTTPPLAAAPDQGEDGVDNSTPAVDNTPPEIFLEQTKSPADGSDLIVFLATDRESGIMKTQMRQKKWLSNSDWEDVVNPVLYPEGAWKVELRAFNNAGLESVKSIISPLKLAVRIAIVLLGVIVLVILSRAVYNRQKRKLFNHASPL